MQKVIASIADMLEALPYQVELWDEQVINHLVHNPQLLNHFEEGGEDIKWSIYHSIKYSHHHP